MAITWKLQAVAAWRSRRYFQHNLFSIGPRLLIGFQVIILLTGLIGFLAVQRFSALTATTTELNTHCLPEVMILGRLRTLLFQQHDQERYIVSNTDGDGDLAKDLVGLRSTLKMIASERSALLAVEPFAMPGPKANDVALSHQLTDGIVRSNALAMQVQTLVSHGQIKQAHMLEESKQEPLLQKALDTTAQLNAREEGEMRVVAAQVQQESSTATMLVFTLTILALMLSFLLALVITRSLTKPISTLLHATEAIASGDLEVRPQVVRNDEIGQLAKAFNKMRLNLRSNIATLALERQQTQAIIDASADGLVLVDPQGKILQFNPAAERLSGWQTSEALGRHCWEVFGCRGATAEESEEHEQLCPLIMASRTDSEQAYAEMHTCLRNGQQRWLAMSCASIPLDDKTTEHQLVMGIHDISQLKAVEQLKSDFVAMVSHELRAPLTTVSSSVEMLSLLNPAVDNETYNEVLGILGQQTRRLRHVVEEVLQLTRFGADRLQVRLRPLLIAQFLHAFLESTRLEWVGDDHMLCLRTPQEDILVWADQELLEIVIRNLLDNARKYTPPGSQIEVEIMAAMERVQVRVIDHGPGIPPDQLHHIFEPFSRGTRSSYHWTRGYGLGLYIVSELLRAHDGEIWVENRQERGACFVLSLWAVKDDNPHGIAEDDETRICYEPDDTHD